MVELFATVDVDVVLEDVPAVHGGEAGAAVEVSAVVDLGVTLEVVALEVGEAEAAIEEGGGMTTDAVVPKTVSAGAAVETLREEILADVETTEGVAGTSTFDCKVVRGVLSLA